MTEMKYVVIEYQDYEMDESFFCFDSQDDARVFMNDIWNRRMTFYSEGYLEGGYEVFLFHAECELIDGLYWEPIDDLVFDDFTPIDVLSEEVAV